MKYQNIIDNMTTKEKAAFLSGKSEWQTRDFPRLDIRRFSVQTDRMVCETGWSRRSSGNQSSSTGNLFSYSGSYGKQLG